MRIRTEFESRSFRAQRSNFVDELKRPKCWRTIFPFLQSAAHARFLAEARRSSGQGNTRTEEALPEHP